MPCGDLSNSIWLLATPQIYRDMQKFPHAVRAGVQRRRQPLDQRQVVEPGGVIHPGPDRLDHQQHPLGNGADPW